MFRFASIVLCAMALVACQAPATHRASLKQPLIIPILYHGQELYQGIEDYKFTRAGKEETVPKGFVYDGASIPLWARFYVTPDGLIRPAACVHDWTYELHGHLKNGLVLNRLQADQMLYDYMVEAGISRTRAGVIYRCVRLGGSHAWNTVEEPLILPVNNQLRGAQLPGHRRSIYYIAP